MERPAVARRERTMWRMHARGLVRDGDGGGGWGRGGTVHCLSLRVVDAVIFGNEVVELLIGIGD